MKENYCKETTPCPPIPDGYETSMAYLTSLVCMGAKEKLGNYSAEEVSNRVCLELDIIEKKGWADQFLFLKDAVDSARKNLDVCLPGPGRNTQACSLVNYLLGITQINPLAFDLPFERFANQALKTSPDIGMEVDSDSYEDFISMMKNKYGDRMASMAMPYKHKDGTITERVSGFLWAFADTDLCKYATISTLAT